MATESRWEQVRKATAAKKLELAEKYKSSGLSDKVTAAKASAGVKINAAKTQATAVRENMNAKRTATDAKRKRVAPLVGDVSMDSPLQTNKNETSADILRRNVLANTAADDEEITESTFMNQDEESEDTAQYEPETPQLSTREKLERFYTDNAPDKIMDIDKIMKAFQGKESQMWAGLEVKYSVRIDYNTGRTLTTDEIDEDRPKTKLQKRVDSLKGMMKENLELALGKQEALEKLRSDLEQLEADAAEFKRGSSTIKRKMFLRRIKAGAICVGLGIGGLGGAILLL